MRLTQRKIALAAIAVLAAGGLSLSAQQPERRTSADVRMSGTYELESTRGGNPQRAAESATRSLPPGERDRAYQSLFARLNPPQRLSIDRDGRLISIASDRGPRASFDADGRIYSDRDQDGRMVSTRADVDGDRVGVDVEDGRRGSSFSVMFESINNGANLRVTRRLDNEDLARPITFQSYYRRLSREPRWDVYDDGPGFSRGRGYARGRGDDGRGIGWVGWNPANVTVPDGMSLVVTLDTPLSMRTSRNGEAFSMTVRGPAEFQSARIHGVVSRVRASRGDDMDMRVDFQRIDVRGRSMDFDAVLNTIRLSDGTVMHVNADGEVRENSTGETVRNGAIGVAIGTVVGALAGGGKGAAIGAVIGGAGGVILSRGHEQLDLPRGTEVTLTALSRYRAP